MKGSVLKDARGNVSSKRVFGAIGFVSCMVTSIVLTIISVRSGNDVGSNAAGLLTTMTVVSGSLLGIGVVEHFALPARGSAKKRG